MPFLTLNFLHVLLVFFALNNIKYSMCMSEEMLELANMLHQSCQAETGVAENLIEDARKGSFAEDNNLKCYMMCLMNQMAVIEDDGTVDEDGVIAVMPDEYKDIAEKVIRGCGTKRGVDACDTSFQTHKCWYIGAPDHYFLP